VLSSGGGADPEVPTPFAECGPYAFAPRDPRGRGPEAQLPGIVSTIVPTAIPRDVEVEAALRAVQAQHPDEDVRILNGHRPKRDV
jgi:hypothetical protein